MSILAQYSRQDWQEQGEWSGVEDYVNSVILEFADDDEPDELEEVPEVRTERLIDGDTLVTVSRHRHFRTYMREDDGSWSLAKRGTHTFKEQIVLGGGTVSDE